MNTLALIGLGFGIGMLVSHLIAVRPLQKSILRMYYDGFKVAAPPPRPKTVPVDPTRHIRED